MRRTWLQPGKIPPAQAMDVLGQALRKDANLEELLRRPEISYADLMQLVPDHPPANDPAVVEQLEIQARYSGYLERQNDEIAKQLRHESTELPVDFDYTTVRGLSNEVQQKLNDTRPTTIGQAGRISGVTPAAVSLLLVHLKKHAMLAA